MANLWIYVGALAALMSAIQLLPQVYKSFVTKKIDDVSIYMLVMMITGTTLWIAYGFYLSDYPIIVSSGLNLLAVISLLYMKYNHR